MRVVSEAAACELKAMASDYLVQIEARLAHSTHVAADHLTLADIVLFCFVEFGAQIGQTIPAEMRRLHRWRDAMRARPSAAPG